MAKQLTILALVWTMVFAAQPASAGILRKVGHYLTLPAYIVGGAAVGGLAGLGFWIIDGDLAKHKGAKVKKGEKP